MTKHTNFTPGPWTVDRSNGRIFGANGAEVCVVFSDHNDDAARNESLIAAAPDLYAALSSLIERVETYAEWASRDAIASRSNTTSRGILESVREHNVLTAAHAALAKVQP
jgi:hypothetical protein